MPITIKLPTPLRRHAEQAKNLEVCAATVGDALAQLTATYPAMQAALFGGSGDIKPFVRVFVDGKDIADLDGPATTLAEGSVISIVPPVAGA
jgi:molybdopterin converting factor small subunit